MLRALFGGSKCRTIDKLDILGDGSCIALYRLDGNANDESGNYHGIETATAYGGGAYERGAILTASNNSKISLPNVPLGSAFTISWWVKSNGARSVNIMFSVNPSGHLFYYRIDNNTIEITTNYVYSCPSNTTGEYFDGNLHLLTIEFDGTTTKFYKDLVEVPLSQGVASTKPTSISVFGAYTSTGYTFNGMLDQMRVFNRKIIDAERAILYAECAPTSILADINPFLDNSLKALYPFDGNANDLTGAFNGSVIGAPTYTTGKIGQAVTVGGANQILSAYNSFSLFTLSFWAKANSAVNANYAIGMHSGSNYCGLGMSAWSGNVHISLWNDAGAEANLTTPSAPSGDTYLSLNYKHFALVKLSADTYTLYINGIRQLTATIALTLDQIRFGNFSNGSATGIMQIDNAVILNKACTPMEIASLICNTTPLEEPLYTLVDPFRDFRGKALWRFEGNALDESGNFNGTVSNITWSAGTIGRYASFNGSTSGITTANFAGYKALTVRAKKTASGLQYALVGGSDDSWFGFSDASDSNMKISINGAGSIQLTMLSAISLNTFYDFALVWETATSLSLYRDGVLQSTTVVSNYQTTAMIYIGRRASALNLNGGIDEIRLFNDILTATEVLRLHNGI